MKNERNDERAMPLSNAEGVLVTYHDSTDVVLKCWGRHWIFEGVAEAAAFARGNHINLKHHINNMPEPLR